MTFPFIGKKKALFIFLSSLDEQNFGDVFYAAEKMKVNVSVYDALALEIINYYGYVAYERKASFQNISDCVSDDVHRQLIKLFISYGAVCSVLLLCSNRDLVLDSTDLRSLVCCAVQQKRFEEFSELRKHILERIGNLDLPTQTAKEYLEMIDSVQEK